MFPFERLYQGGHRAIACRLLQRQHGMDGRGAGRQVPALRRGARSFPRQHWSSGPRCPQCRPVPPPPFNPYVRLSRIWLPDGLLDMVRRLSDGAHELVQALVMETTQRPTPDATTVNVAARFLMRSP
jgi:hypothetical protein